MPPATAALRDAASSAARASSAALSHASSSHAHHGAALLRAAHERAVVATSAWRRAGRTPRPGAAPTWQPQGSFAAASTPQLHGGFATGPMRQLHGGFAAAAAQLPRTARTDGGPRRVVAVGVSGGVDSAVAALRLKEAGHEVHGLFMRNWDEREETGNENCSVEADFQDARRVCEQIGIPLKEVDFVTEYWNRVFQSFVDECAQGLTPNPDLACNRHIKFDAFLEYALSEGADLVATGHYAQLRADDATGLVQLLRGRDPEKDQSYFLASVRQAALPRFLFPCGGLLKSEVRAVAAAAGLHTADKRSSRGICFIGKRSFDDFLQQYVPPVPGTFVSVETGAEVGAAQNISTITAGQNARLSGLTEKMFVAGKDLQARRVYVAPGTHHPALHSRSARLRPAQWIAGTPPSGLAADGAVALSAKPRYRAADVGCTLRPHGGAPAASDGLPAAPNAAAAFRPSAYTRLAPGAVTDDAGGRLVAVFDDPVRGLAPAQACVFYDGDVCLGAAAIEVPGRTVHEERMAHLGEAC